MRTNTFGRARQGLEAHRPAALDEPLSGGADARDDSLHPFVFRQPDQPLSFMSDVLMLGRAPVAQCIVVM